MDKKILDFVKHCEIAKRLSKKTIKAYQIDLNQFKIYSQKDEVKDISKQDINSYFIELSKFSPRTMKRKVATLKTFFSYLEFEGEIAKSPFKEIQLKIKLNFTVPKTLDLTEIEKILKFVYKKKKSIKDKNSFMYAESIRDIAIIELLLATGIRVSELCSLQIKNIGDNFCSIKINGKGNKERVIPITNEATKLALYENYKLNVDFITKTSYLFKNRFSNHISEQSVRHIVKKYAQKAKINGNITPHVFRHSFATLLLEEDVDIRYIQHFLGHSSIAVTQIYTHVNERKKKELLKLKNPRNAIVI